jgi:polyferredoxin
MSLIQINWNPGPRQLRGFGLVILVGFGVLGAARLLWPAGAESDRGIALALAFFGIALAVGVIGLTGTRAALPFYWAWMAIAYGLGGIMGRVLFGLFFYGLLTPLALLMRLTGRDRLQLRRRATASHWHSVPAVNDLGRYERQS